MSGVTQGKDTSPHFSIAPHSGETFGTRRLLLGVGRRLADDETEAPDAAVLTVAPSLEEQNVTERVDASVPVSEALRASPSNVADASGEEPFPQPSAISPDVVSESVSAEKTVASLPELPSPVGDSSGEASSPQPSTISPDVDSESVSAAEAAASLPEVLLSEVSIVSPEVDSESVSAVEATASLPEVSSAINETIGEASAPGTEIAAPEESETNAVNGTENEDEAKPVANALIVNAVVVSTQIPNGVLLKDHGDLQPPDVKTNELGAVDGEGDSSEPAGKKTNRNAMTAAVVSLIPPPGGA